MKGSEVIELHFSATANSTKILIALTELKLPFQIVRYDLYKGDHLKPAYRKINPNLKVPAIVDNAPLDGGDPITVFESGAILLYLAERGGALISTDIRERFRTIQWLTWQVAGLGPMTGQANHFVHYAPPGDHEYAKTRYLNEATRLLHVLEYRLKQAPYLAGNEYSIADIACWPLIHRYNIAMKVDLDTLPSVKRWMDEIEARPAVREVMSRDDIATGRRYEKRPELSEEERSNIFGERFLQAVRQD